MIMAMAAASGQVQVAAPWNVQVTAPDMTGALNQDISLVAALEQVQVTGMFCVVATVAVMPPAKAMEVLPALVEARTTTVGVASPLAMVIMAPQAIKIRRYRFECRL